MFSSYPLAIIFRYVLHPDHTPSTIRYLFSFVMGTLIGLLCFGPEQMAVLFFIISVSYLLLLFISPHYVQRYSMVWAMGSIATAHIYRMVTDYGGFHLDFTGPLMVMVQKITLVAYAIHDGQARKDSELNQDQRKQKLTTIPGTMEYFTYMFNFHSLLAGITCTMKEYLAFMDGSNLKPSTDSQPDAKQSREPSSAIPVLSKLLQSIICLILFVTVSKYVNNSHILDPRYHQPFRLLINYINSMRLRWRYYFIWLLAESINNCAGLGFSGYDKKGVAKWNLISNINIWDIEMATNMRSISIHWNAISGLWLRRCVYERMSYAPTLATYTVSAWWHGFYPGYYLCFIYFGIITEAARKIRRLLHHRFQGNSTLRFGYDVATWLVTHIYLDYGVLCLDMMFLSSCITYWNYYYYFPLISSLLVALFFPSGKTSRTTKPNTDNQASNQAKPETKTD